MISRITEKALPIFLEKNLALRGEDLQMLSGMLAAATHPDYELSFEHV